MEVSYKKDLDKNYMLVKTKKELASNYKIQMVCNNKIPGLNPVSIKQFNNENTFYYDVSGKISMASEYTGRKMNAEDIRTYIMGIQRLLESAKQYMLDLDKVLMDFEYVYLNPVDKSPQFCYYPEKEEDFSTSLQSAFDKMIEVADHSDRETVIISYGLQQLRIGVNNVTINDIVKFVNENRKKEEDTYEQSGEYLQEDTNIKSGCLGESITCYGREGSDKSISLSQKIREILKPIINMKDNVKNLGGKYQSEEEMENDREESRLHRKESRPDWKESESDCKESNTNREEIEPDWKGLDIGQRYLMEEADSDATVLLSSGDLKFGIVLKCSDEERAQTIIPNDFPCILGKSKKSADYIIEDKTVSRVHVRLHQEEGEYYIEDLNSTNGTYLNEEKLSPHKLKKVNIGDKLKLSEIEYVVC